MKQFISFVQKEFYHIFRDGRTILILLVMPIILIVLFGYAITTEVKNTQVAILDLSKDEVTQKIKERIAANDYFGIKEELTNAAQIDKKFKSGDIDMVILFEENFSGNLIHNKKADIQILVDGTEPNQASVRIGYIQQLLTDCQRELIEQLGIKQSFQIIPITRMLYNPQQKSEYNFVPGVIGLILILICAMMSSIAIVREKEMGTMEILLASPLPSMYIILAKLVPYFTISSLNMATILLLSVYLLHIPIAGSLSCFIGVSLIYILVALFIGLLISTLVNSQLSAMILSLLLIVPTVYLSGITFPIESMPVALQRVSAIVPTRWYVEAARKLMIQGVEAKYVLKETAILVVMAIALLVFALKMFKTRLE